MYRENSEFALKVQKEADILIELPERWKHTSNSYLFTPRDIRVVFRHPERYRSEVAYATKIFTCYFTLLDKKLKISRLLPAQRFEAINDRTKALLDAYLPKVLQEFIHHAQLLECKYVIVESSIAMIVNAFIDLNFRTSQEDINYVGEYKCQK